MHVNTSVGANPHRKVKIQICRIFQAFLEVIRIKWRAAFEKSNRNCAVHISALRIIKTCSEG